MTPEFDRAWTNMGLNDDHLKKLQQEIILNPKSGSVIQGTGGLRKIRFAIESGKSSGARVLYIDLVIHEEVYLITAYPKSKKIDLTKQEKLEIKKMIDKLKNSTEKRRAGK